MSSTISKVTKFSIPARDLHFWMYNKNPKYEEEFYDTFVPDEGCEADFDPIEPVILTSTFEERLTMLMKILTPEEQEWACQEMNWDYEYERELFPEYEHYEEPTDEEWLINQRWNVIDDMYNTKVKTI